MFAAVLPYRYWARFPVWMPITAAAFPSSLATIFLGAAVGIPGFLAHAGYNRGDVQGFAGLSIFTFLFLTPAGLLTLYLLGSGTLRAACAWFEDPLGDPILTGIDHAVFAGA